MSDKLTSCQLMAFFQASLADSFLADLDELSDSEDYNVSFRFPLAKGSYTAAHYVGRLLTFALISGS